MGRWSVEVDGLVLPKPVSGHPALELCNTLAAWEEDYDPARDYLHSYRHLAVLARETGFVSTHRTGELCDRVTRAGGDTPAMRRELARARAVRSDSRAALLGTASDSAFERLAQAARVARQRQRLTRDGNGVSWTWKGSPRISEPLDAILLAVTEVLIANENRHVRACPGHGCGWLFLDPTGRRRWCQMAVCGNRAKQARLRRR